MTSVLFVLSILSFASGSEVCTDAAHQVSETACTTDCKWTSGTPSCTAPSACTALETCTATDGCRYNGAVGVCKSADDIACAAFADSDSCNLNSACTWRDAGWGQVCSVAECTDDGNTCRNQKTSTTGCQEIYSFGCTNLVAVLTKLYHAFNKAVGVEWCSANEVHPNFLDFCVDSVTPKTQTELYNEGCGSYINGFKNYHTECDWFSNGECDDDGGVCKTVGGSLTDAECAAYATTPLTCATASYGVCQNTAPCSFDTSFSLFTCVLDGGVCSAASNSSGQCRFQRDLTAPYTCGPVESSAAACAAQSSSQYACNSQKCEMSDLPAHCGAIISCSAPAVGVAACDPGCTYVERASATCTRQVDLVCGSAGNICTAGELAKGCVQAPVGVCTGKQGEGEEEEEEDPKGASNLTKVPFSLAAFILLIFLLLNK